MSYRRPGSSRGSGYRSPNDQGSVFGGGSAGGPSLQIFIGLALLAGVILFAGVLAFNLGGGAPATPPVAAQPTATPVPQPTAAPTEAPAAPPSEAPATGGGGGPLIEAGEPELILELLPEPMALAFVQTELRAPANTLVELIFDNQNDLGVQHNWVLIDGGTSVADVVNTAAGGNAADLFAPPAGTDGALAWTPMLNVGDVGDITFRTPSEPGTYLYICTFPGHYIAGMVGDLIVE
jgi:plastocyanin